MQYYLVHGKMYGGLDDKKKPDYTNQWIRDPLKIGEEDPNNPEPPEQSPGQQLKYLIKVFGEPDFFDGTRNGLALWKNSTLRQRGHCYERVTISDYSTAFIDVWLTFSLPYARGDPGETRLLRDLTQLYQGFSYDPLKQVLYVDTTNINDTSAYAVVALRLITGKVNLSEAQQLLPKMLAFVNPRSKTYNPYATRQFTIEICQTLRDLRSSSSASATAGKTDQRV